MQLFNAKGELNATSMKDALVALAKYASIMEENTPSNMHLAGQPSLSETQRDELITRAVQSQDGKIALASAMANPIN